MRLKSLAAQDAPDARLDIAEWLAPVWCRYGVG